MNSKKSIFRLMAAIVFVCVLAGTLAVEAANEFTLLNENCKDVVNDGIPFTTATSISGQAIEVWRDRIQVTVTDPNGSNNYLSPKDVVKELTLYAASNNTAYQCQQLTEDSIENDFSCNSFPAGGTIARISIRFIPKIQTSPNQVLEGKYGINIFKKGTPTDVIFTGTAKIDAGSTACAWNQTSKEFIPKEGAGFIYKLCDKDDSKKQEFKFLENSDNPFTIVSFPSGETIDPKRFVLYGNSVINEFGYTLKLVFEDLDTTPKKYTITYSYKKGTDPKSGSVVPGPDSDSDWSDVILPLKLVSGSLTINRDGTPVNSMPQKTNFTFTFYYKNIDPTIGYENSMFHFIRTMTVEFAPCIADENKYKISSTAYDPCIASKQTFTVPFINEDTGLGYEIETVSTFWPKPSTKPSTLSIPTGTYDSTNGRHFYFDTKKCTNADCTTLAGTDAYVYRVYVSDGDTDDRYWHYAEASDSTITKFAMRVYKGTDRPFRVNSMLLTARSSGTYRVRAFIPDNLDAGYIDRAWMEFYITIPEKSGQSTCQSSGQDGVFKASWDGCGENYVQQTLEFLPIKEQYGFVSNYSNQKLTYEFSSTNSTIPTAINITELYCDWQVLAEGYSSSGAVCSPQKLELPPYTRAIIKGGKFTIGQKPAFNTNADYEYILAYNRPQTSSNMNLFLDMVLKECPQEAIPDTGYSLRSPQPMMSVKDQSEFIFTGNSLQIPAIGLGMETPIPIVHVYYLNGAFENGWDLSMLGGYVGELEGGAYIPYPGNAVLTGHFYSQGVFVNLVNLKLEDEIIVYATDGMKYIYKVTNSYWTEPNNVYQLFQPNGEKSLTLVTCDDYNFIDDTYQKRYIVQATLVSSEPYQQ
ncbi:MAG TPA: sortase [Flexilinea sp.]|nr:sortase [Flexilinea sp.]HPR71020.1 sortase [Flexilinea sp.]